jgi:hypothetical protein
MSKVIVNAGVCGFETEIFVESEDSRNCSVTLNTQCPNLKSMDEELQNLDAFKECFAKVGDSQVFEVARKHCKHPACPVPTGIIKGIEVACRLALPKKAEIRFE